MITFYGLVLSVVFFIANSLCRRRNLTTVSKGQYKLCDKLQQHVAATNHSVYTGRATAAACCCNLLPSVFRPLDCVTMKRLLSLLLLSVTMFQCIFVIHICYSSARRSVLGETVPEVLSTARAVSYTHLTLPTKRIV